MGTGSGRLSSLRSVARQERVRLSERTLAGLQRAKAHGRVGGRPRTEQDPRTMAKLATLRQSHVKLAVGLRFGNDNLKIRPS
jgi:DNA invertase Pin-like site-specific DNA recombinase